MGAANSMRKLTVDTIALLEQLEPNKAEMQAKARAQARIHAILSKEWSTCRLLAYGSSESGFGFGGSDLDLGIYFEDVDVDCQGHFAPHEKVEILTKACGLLFTEFEVKQFIPNARVPVLKLWDPVNDVACDICVGSVHALLNTALLKYYGQLDPRVRPLAFAVKYWAKHRGINDSINGTLSSYAFTMLLIFYLQSRHSNAVLPCAHSIFHRLLEEKTVSSLLKRLETLPTMEMPATFGVATGSSVGALLSGFFQFYASEFRMDDDVVSIRTGVALSKTTKWSRPVQWRISIEDPFELSHDVGRVIFNKKGQELINNEFRRAYQMILVGKRLEDICVADHSSWGANASCYICEAHGHNARECIQVSSRMDTTMARTSSCSLLADCWYCGETGHFKASCPLLSFHNIPLQGFSPIPAPAVNPMMLAATIGAMASCDLISGCSPRRAKNKICALNSPSRPSKKKKRSRSSTLSSPQVHPVKLQQIIARRSAAALASGHCQNSPVPVLDLANPEIICPT